jgi:SHS2 domain-containing protein
MGFEIIEHTADVGIRAWGGTLAETFEQATLGLAAIMGIHVPEAGESVSIEVEAPDPGALLVDWLSEILWLHDANDALIGAIEATDVTPTRASGGVTLVDRAGREVSGTQVKAITYHQLEVRNDESGWHARVYVDV